ncbi:MAG: hypothetical protein LBR76_08840 [Oscillospiraceae bacterium]|jgi:D-alanyl-lipoteichoic acid acyltransferase DltB (MBOAT superfamily)|nr:hypothetical protein [Oscillospiraceae bacterium]
MLVTSPLFLLFSAAVILADRFMPVRFRAALLLAASFVSYGFWRLWAPLFIAGYTLLNYALTFLIRKHPKAAFPFALFLHTVLFILLGRAELFTFERLPALENLIFPLGFSYYMFRCIGYQADVARKKLEPERNPVNLALFLCFYPILTMGPINRAGDFLPQIQNPERPDAQVWRDSLFVIGLSLFKKFVFADNIWRLIAPRFAAGQAETVNNGGIWFFLLLCYLIQLYLDFSAYTDIALSVSRLLGFRVNPNFRAPFLSQSISDFWRRWHMGLSHWFSDYLFTPLQIKLRTLGIFASVTAAFVTLAVSGMWHRFTLNYLAWGLATAFFIAFDAVFAKRRKKIAKAVPKRLFAVVTTVITFIISVFVITFVCAGGFSQSVHILSRALNPAAYQNLSGAWAALAGANELLIYLLAAAPFVAFSHALELKPQILTALFAKTGRVPFFLRAVLLVLLIYVFIFCGRFDADIVGGFQYAQF